MLSPSHQSLLFQRQGLPASTGRAPFEKVIGLVAEAVLPLTAVERARQRKDNKGKSQ